MIAVDTLFKGRYKILRVVQRNNLCPVYVAIDEKTNHLWEITEIHHNAVSQQTIITHIKSLCRLSHPNLLRIVDIISEEKSYFVVHECIQGRFLDEFLSQSEILSQERAISVIKQICQALQHLYIGTKGAFYGNISPSTIFLKPDGNAVLTGYLLTSEYIDIYSQDSVCLGTKGYCAPEQIGIGNIDSRTDIYCVGMLLFSLLTGKNLSKQSCEDMPNRDFDVDIPQGLVNIIEKCTQPSPEDRYQSFSELMFDLEDNGAAYACCIKKKRSREFLHLMKAFFRGGTGYKKKRNGIKDIRFSAFAPKNFLKGEYTIVEIAMYEDKYKNVAAHSSMTGEIGETTTGYLRVADKTEVCVCLSSPDVQIEDNVRTQVWYGKYLKFQFAVNLSKDFSKKQLLFNASIYFNNIIATKITFVARCSSMREQKMKVFRNDILSAFISYASQDRNRVALIIQGMRKSRPDMDIFFDVDALRSGEKWEQRLIKEIEDRDVLFLCWSRFAKESKWVETEWKYALSKKGIDSIEPIPLEPPMNCPPPKELESKHFNDRELFYCI